MPPKANPAHRLFCLPFAGGNTALFRDWHRALPDDVEICALQLPGRGHRLHETPFGSIDEAVESLAVEIRRYLDRPFSFFGHSLGAMIGFELTRRLRAQRNPAPNHLFVSGRRAPHLPDEDPPFHGETDERLIEELRRLNGTARELLQSSELLRLVLPMIRADFRMAETYVYAPDGEPLPVPITAFGGTEDEESIDDRLDAWRDQTTSHFVKCMIPGDHFFIQTRADAVLKVLRATLARYSGARPRDLRSFAQTDPWPY